MTRTGRTITTWATVGILLCSTLSAGCEPAAWLGGNLTVDLLLPLGLGGSPGLLNPFGIVQAWVNTQLGADAPSGAGSEDTTALDAPQPPTFLDPTIGVIIDRP